MKPTLIGAGVMFFSTLFQLTIEMSVWPQLQSLAGPLRPLLIAHARLLGMPTRLLNRLFEFHPQSMWFVIAEVFVLNTLIGALLGWAAGKIWRAWKSRTPSSS
jgi:hypothetical protein